jgi:membrane-bound serine protease (ClpP class)
MSTFWNTVLTALLLLTPASGSAQSTVILFELEGVIGPASGDFVKRGLTDAQARGAELVILRLDTPGGLDSAMRDIVQAILSSSTPVATYVAPGGARAASAGTYILYASHIAAMAPATNLGAATPVRIGGLPSPPTPPDDGTPDPETDPSEDPPEDEKPAPAAITPMERKLVNDARAYIRSLAQLRGRNARWAERSVEQGASLSAEEALAQNVIDIVAEDEADLLRQLQGRTVKIAGVERTLNTSDGVVEVVSPDWRNRVLAVISNPQVAYILMLLGVYGLFFELSNPGALVPGVLGGICLLLALFAFQVLPINYAGLALIGLGLIFMISEAFLPSFGILGLGGIAAFVVGSLILWDRPGPGYGVPFGMILGFALANAVVLIGLSMMLIRQRRRPLVSGEEQLPGAVAVVTDEFDGAGRVRLHGESWRARSDSPLQAGQRVEVIKRDGLVLMVRPLSKRGQEK